MWRKVNERKTRRVTKEWERRVRKDERESVRDVREGKLSGKSEKEIWVKRKNSVRNGGRKKERVK